MNRTLTEATSHDKHPGTDTFTVRSAALTVDKAVGSRRHMRGRNVGYPVDTLGGIA